MIGCKHMLRICLKVILNYNQTEIVSLPPVSSDYNSTTVIQGEAGHDLPFEAPDIN